MEYKQLITLINVQQETIMKLELDKIDLFKGYTILMKTIQEQKEEIAQLKGE